MAVRTLQDPQIALTQYVSKWDRRWRSTQIVRWLPFALLPGLALGIGLALLARVRPVAPSAQILLVAVIVMVAGAALLAGWMWLRDRSMLTAARRLDLLLGLDERLSTALELLDGRIHTSDALAALQIDDAKTRAHAAQPSRALPFHSPIRIWLAVTGLALLLAALLLIPNIYDAQAAADTAQTAAITEAAETIRQITQDVAADPALSDETRESLIETLDNTADVLAQNDVSPEEAFAAVSDSENALRGVAQQFDQQTRAARNAAAAAASALQGEAPSESGQGDNFEQLAQALQQAAAASGTTQSASQDMQQALQQTSSALQSSGAPSMQQAAQQIEQASQQLQNGDSTGAQQSLEQAQEQIEQAAQEQQQDEQAADSAGQQADQAQQAASQISESGDQPPQQGEESQGQQDAQGQQQGQSQSEQGQGGQQSPSQAGRGEQQGQQGESGGSSASQQGSQSSQSGQQSGQPSQQGQDGQASQQGQQAASGSQGQSSGQLSASAVSEAGAGSGDGQSGSAQLSGSGQTDQSNRPDGQGERAYDSVFAPQRLGGELSQEDIFLQSDDPNAPVVEGEYAQNPTGTSRVPYNQVFSSYANAASQALQNGYVPLGLRDVIRNYFSSLEPARSNAGP